MGRVGFEEEQLRHDRGRERVVYWAVEADDALFQEPREDVVGVPASADGFGYEGHGEGGGGRAWAAGGGGIWGGGLGEVWGEVEVAEGAEEGGGRCASGQRGADAVRYSSGHGVGCCGGVMSMMEA